MLLIGKFVNFGVLDFYRGNKWEATSKSNVLQGFNAFWCVLFSFSISFILPKKFSGVGLVVLL